MTYSSVSFNTPKKRQLSPPGDSTGIFQAEIPYGSGSEAAKTQLHFFVIPARKTPGRELSTPGPKNGSVLRISSRPQAVSLQHCAPSDGKWDRPQKGDGAAAALGTPEAQALHSAAPALAAMAPAGQRRHWPCPGCGQGRRLNGSDHPVWPSGMVRQVRRDQMGPQRVRRTFGHLLDTLNLYL